jgi:hypothetical protein
MFWRRARELYLGCWMVTVLLILPNQASVLTAPGATLETLGALVGGAIISLVFFSDLSERYRDPVRVGLAPCATELSPSPHF